MFKKYERTLRFPVNSPTFWDSEFATALAIRVLPHPGGP
jgi:hypothetical protein